jgi:hypothetical protein
MMPKINFRCPPELLAAAEKLAADAGLSVGEWMRGLVEKETGIEVEVKMGLAAMDPKTRKRVQQLGAKAGGIAKAAAQGTAKKRRTKGKA